MNHRARTRHVRLAGRNITTIGISSNIFADFYHRCMTMRWTVFLACALLIFLVINIIFAGLLLLQTGAVDNVPADKPWHVLYFSVETLATVGYGDMHPATDYGHIVASIETIVGMLFNAVLTGLIFARFARPRARILASRSLVIAPHDAQNSLMVRVANERLNTISDAKARLWVLFDEKTVEGNTFRRFTELSLLRNNQPMFVLSWLIAHPIDESSPLYGMTADDFATQNISFVLIITGNDETITQEVRTRHVYSYKDVLWEHRFADILTSDEQGITMDYNHFHSTVAHTNPKKL